MYRSSRPHLGSSNTLSPFRKLQKDSSENTAAFLLAVCMCVIYYGLTCILCLLVLFFGGPFYADLWDGDEKSFMFVYTQPWMAAVRIIGYIVILIIAIVKQKQKKMK